MASLKDMRVRIASTKATQKITKAMQMVAASKLRRAQMAAEAARPYAQRMDTVIGNNNLIVHQLLERGATPFPVLLTLFRRPSGMIIASLRSRNGEALKIAEKLQGGGHANACGATLPKSIRTIPDAITYLRHVFNPALKKETPLNNLESLFASIEVKGSQ